MPVANVRTQRELSRDNSTVRAPLLIRDGAEVTSDAVWAWFTIQTQNSDYVEEHAADEFTTRTATELRSLLPRDAAFHLKIVWAPYSAAAYRESVAAITGNLAPGWNEWVQLGADRIERFASPAGEQSEQGLQYRQKTVLLGVQIAGADSGRRRLRDHPLVRRLASPSSAARGAHERLDEAAPAISELAKRFASSHTLTASPTPAGVLAWSYAREFARPGDPAPPRANEFARARLAGLITGQAQRSDDGLSMRVTDAHSGRACYVATLVAAVDGFPATEMVNPGSEWLATIADLPGVEVSVRGQHHGQTGSVSRLDRASRTVRSQLRDADAAGAEASEELYEADDEIKSRRATVRHRDDVLGVVHPRWIVTADDPQTLADRVSRVIDHYAGLVKLEWLPWIQDLLWCETLPGESVRVPEFGQEQPLITLAGSWFHGGSVLGDGLGPYLGANLGSTPGPVQAHVVRRDGEHRHDPTTITSTGQSGMGKSTLIMRMTLDGLAEGSWSLLVDVKGDLVGVVRAARELLGVSAQTVDATAPECAGMLDPLRFAHSVDEARGHAVTALQMALSDDEQRRFGAIVESAVERVLQRPREQHSMPAVLGELTAAESSEWQAAGQTLTTRAQQAGLRLVCQPATAAAISPERGLVYVNMSGLPLPDPQESPQEWKAPQRGAMVALQMAFAFAMEQARTHRTMKKLVALTELHRITGYSTGRTLVAHLARMGRALQTYLLLDSQGAHDLAAVEQVIEQTIMAFSFRAPTQQEREAQAQLLGRPDAGPVITGALDALERGEAMMRDRYGRIGRVAADLLSPWLRDTLDTAAADDTDDALASGDGHGRDGGSAGEIAAARASGLTGSPGDEDAAGPLEGRGTVPSSGVPSWLQHLDQPGQGQASAVNGHGES